MYDEHGGCPSGGVVVKIEYISKKQCIVVATVDATVRQELGFQLQEKRIYVLEIAIENKIPIIYLVDSARFICQCR